MLSCRLLYACLRIEGVGNMAVDVLFCTKVTTFQLHV